MTDDPHPETLDLPADEPTAGNPHKARWLYILADMVQCGCADVAIETESNPLDPHRGAIRIVGTSRTCARNHAADWRTRSRESRTS